MKQYKGKEEKLNRIRLVDEKLKEHQNEVKVTQKEKDDAVKQLAISHLALEILSKSRNKPNNASGNAIREEISEINMNLLPCKMSIHRLSVNESHLLQTLR